MVNLFDWTEFSIKSKKFGFSKWKWIKTVDLTRLAKIEKYKDSDIFRSVWTYEKKDLNSRKIGDFHMDFDSEGSIEKAQKDVVKTLKIFEEYYKINPKSLQCGFSGSKGFFIIIPINTFLKESIKTPEKFYKMIGEFFKLSTHTLDLSVYKIRGMWRITNTIHQKTGLYRIPLTPDELKKLSVDEIKTLASSPRKVEQNTPELSVNLHKIIQNVQKPKTDTKIIHKYTEVPSDFFIPKNMKHDYFPSDRNHALTRLAGIYKKNGAAYGVARKLILGFNEKYCSPPKTEKDALIPLKFYYG